MINDHPLARFKPLQGDLLKPIYADYSFANLPATLQFLLSGEMRGSLLPADCFGGSYPAPQRIVLFFIDSFGWHFWQRYAGQSRILSRVIQQGTLTPISALFPSTTAASVSTLNLGCLPTRHGVYEWNMYVPTIGETIQTLPFMSVGPKPVSCRASGFDVTDMILERETIHERLKRHGVRSIQLSNAAYAFGPANSLLSKDAETIAHRTLPEALVHLKTALAETHGKALIQLYWAGLDTAAHLHGPGSPVHEAEITSFLHTLDNVLANVESPGTLFLFTADHGHVGVKDDGRINVNERWPELNDRLTISHTGQPIFPNGSPRDMFLHIAQDYRCEALALLTQGLEGAATVMPMDDAIEAGLFGGPVSPTLRERLGDILVLPHTGHFVWWRNALMNDTLAGHHGGLSPEEVITVLGVVDAIG